MQPRAEFYPGQGCDGSVDDPRNTGCEVGIRGWNVGALKHFHTRGIANVAMFYRT